LRCRRSFGPRRENDLSRRGLAHVYLKMTCSRQQYSSGHRACKGCDERSSEAQIAQKGVFVRSAAEWPVKLAFAFGDRHVVDAGDSPAHQPVGIELPVLVAVAAEPVAAVVMPFVCEAHRDAVVVKGPEFLDQAIVELAVPLARQERLDGAASLQELGAVPPEAIDRVG